MFIGWVCWLLSVIGWIVQCVLAARVKIQRDDLSRGRTSDKRAAAAGGGEDRQRSTQLIDSITAANYV